MKTVTVTTDIEGNICLKIYRNMQEEGSGFEDAWMSDDSALQVASNLILAVKKRQGKKV